MYHFDFVVIQNYLVKSMIAGVEGVRVLEKAWCAIATIKAACKE